MAELDPRIKIRAPLRCDGIGRLDCAEDLDSGARLAVRWLPLEANGDAAVKACERLPTHPTLPRIHQTGSVGTSAFVAMDFPEGQVLATMLAERIDVDVVIRIASQLADALATVHEQQVVHGELSAESVLVASTDRASLWDMPLVIANRMTDRRGENRLMQNLPRTAAYLSPERARGSGSSMAGDVYSLGAVLCVAAGAPLPTSSTTLGVVHLVSTGEWLPRVPSTIPDPWRAMLARMVSRDPAQRPSAREVAQAFARPPAPAMLPTVPEMQAVRLPPELMAAAEALAARRSMQPTNEPGASIEPGAAAAADAAVVAEGRTASSEFNRVVVIDPSFGAPAQSIHESTTLDPDAPVPAEVAGDVPVLRLRLDSQEVPEVSARDVVRLPTVEVPAQSGPAPTVEIPAVQMVSLVSATTMQSASVTVVPAPAPVPSTGPSVSVQLTENLSVSPELAHAGAVTLSAEQYAQLQKPATWVYAVGALMAVAILVLLVAAVNLAARQGAAAQRAAETAVPAQVPVTPTPVRQLAVDDEDLAPLTPRKVTRKPPAHPAKEEGFDMPERGTLDDASQPGSSTPAEL